MTAPIVPDPTPAAAQPAPDDNELCGLTVAELREHTAETAALMKRNRELLADHARLQARAEAAERALAALGEGD